MSLIHAQELEKSFGERTLFSDIAFDVFEQDHVGLVERCVYTLFVLFGRNSRVCFCKCFSAMIK